MGALKEGTINNIPARDKLDPEIVYDDSYEQLSAEALWQEEGFTYTI